MLIPTARKDHGRAITGLQFDPEIRRAPAFQHPVGKFVPPEQAVSSDRPGREEDGRGYPCRFQGRGCNARVVGVAVVEGYCDRARRQLAVRQPVHQFLHRYRAEAFMHHRHLGAEQVGANGEAPGIDRRTGDAMVHQDDRRLWLAAQARAEPDCPGAHGRDAMAKIVDQCPVFFRRPKIGGVLASGFSLSGKP